jgi:peptidoglycan/LPS O-acetylase OafA/YrhL
VEGTFSLARFYAKRAKRILPALLLVLLPTWIIGWCWFTPATFRTLGGHMEASSYFSTNLWLYRQSGGPAAYFNVAARYVPLMHLWSLSIEEQFYLVWPTLLLLLLKARRFLTPAIGAIFVASLVFCLFETNTNSTAAFFSLSTRAWELALGALLAQRAVFAPAPQSSPRAIEIRAWLGLLLMLGAVTLVREGDPWPGWRAIFPTLGCALVIAAPGARISRLVLGNRVAQFFGLISYPLYLWHWPLLSVAHIRIGDHLSGGLTAGLLALSVLLATLTWKLAEAKAAAAFSKTPWRIALGLLAGLVLVGLLGAATRITNGFPQRFPAPVLEIFNFRMVGEKQYMERARCAPGPIAERGSLDDERQNIRAFFAGNSCLKIAHPDRPTVVLLGDSHALHLAWGLDTIYADRVNIVIISAGGCGPLLAESSWRNGIAGTMYCLALNQFAFETILALKPAAVIVGTYFAQFYYEPARYYPGFLDDFTANIASLRKAGFQAPIFILGQVPTWSPSAPELVSREMIAGHKPREFTRDGLNPESLKTDALFAANPWGDNTFYLSQVKALCNDEGCRRLVGPHLPQDMIAFDYGHYSVAGSIFAVKNILAPALDPVLQASAPNVAK